jgi:hypothetical protein
MLLMGKIPDYDYDKRNIFVVICDTDIPLPSLWKHMVSTVMLTVIYREIREKKQNFFWQIIKKTNDKYRILTQCASETCIL